MHLSLGSICLGRVGLSVETFLSVPLELWDLSGVTVASSTAYQGSGVIREAQASDSCTTDTFVKCAGVDNLGAYHRKASHARGGVSWWLTPFLRYCMHSMNARVETLPDWSGITTSLL